MGLLEKINSLQAKKSVGLLARAEQMGRKTLPFSVWADRFALKHAAIFSPYNNFFYISESLDIDARTIALSVSTKDFWNGSLDFSKREFQVYSKKEGNLGRFYQFFREDSRHDIEDLYFLPFTFNSQKCILMLVKKQDENFILPQCDSSFISSLSLISTTEKELTIEDIVRDISRYIQGAQANFFIFSYRLSLDVLFSGIDITHPDIKELVINSMSKVIFERLSQLFPEPHCVVKGVNSEIKILYFTHDDVDEQFLLGHIINTFEDYLGKECASSLLLLNAGTSTSEKSAQTFLLKG